MSRAEKFLPFILAILLPIVGSFNQSYNQNAPQGGFTYLQYMGAPVFLLGVWYISQWLRNTKHPFVKRIGLLPAIFVANLLLVAFLVLLNSLFLPSDLNLPIGLVVIRFFIAVTLINVIIHILHTQKERAALKLQNLTLQAENLKFQVEQMKQQINPHFLFNSLNTLLDLVEEDPAAAARYTRNFSNLYRVVLQSAKYDFIPLKDEIKFLDDYWNLLKMRFHDAIDLNVRIEDQKMDYLIPPLSLQFLVENAVKHNEASDKTPLSIDISEYQDRLIIKNRMNLKQFPVEGEKIGLKNLQKRFTLLHQPIIYGARDKDFVVEIPLKVS